MTTLDRLTAPAALAKTPGQTRHVTLGAGAIEALPIWLAREGLAGDIVLVADEHTLAAAGARAEAALTAAGRSVRQLILEPRPGDDHLVCEDGVIHALGAVLAANRHALPVAVGAGTINDIVKMAAHELDRDYVVVPTAASMNGYTSLIAAILIHGVKRTLPARQPIAIFADIDVLAAAPPELNRAGFGDLLSKPFSNADWLLSHLVRDVPYSTAPSDLLDDVFARLLESAHAVGRADHDGLTVLMECILLSGFSMTIAGSSAPASGGEHLVSHYWDMEQFDRGLPLHGLHGTQVGIATRLSALLFERLVALEPGDIHPVQLAQRRPDATLLDRLGEVHDTLSAPVVAELRAQLAQKQLVAGALRAELERVRARWPELREQLRAVLMPAAEITEALRAAGCAERPSQIGVDPARAVKTLRVCHHMRNRYVALDLMDDLGRLEGWAEEVVAEVEAPERIAS